MSDSRRWLVCVEVTPGEKIFYEKAYLLSVLDGVLSFYTDEGKTVVTTFPYHAEEIKP